jgi:hypothetical protein
MVEIFGLQAKARLRPTLNPTAAAPCTSSFARVNALLQSHPELRFTAEGFIHFQSLPTRSARNARVVCQFTVAPDHYARATSHERNHCEANTPGRYRRPCNALSSRDGCAKRRLSSWRKGVRPRSEYEHDLLRASGCRQPFRCMAGLVTKLNESLTDARQRCKVPHRC